MEAPSSFQHVNPASSFLAVSTVKPTLRLGNAKTAVSSFLPCSLILKVGNVDFARKKMLRKTQRLPLRL